LKFDISYEILAKKVVLFVSSEYNDISPLLLPRKNPFGAQGCSTGKKHTKMKESNYLAIKLFGRPSADKVSMPLLDH